jgi:hypothetical protein
MKTSSVLLAQVLFAACVVAVPKGHGLAARVAARRDNALGRSTQPKIPAVGLDVLKADEADRSHVEYSSNWSGGVLTSPPSNSTFTSVTAEFTVPMPSLPKGGTQAASASAWVGIDGDTYSAAILQTGVDFNVDTSGAVSYDAWYEWFPDYAYDFTGFKINPGDDVRVSVVTTSSSAGRATIENLTTGQNVSQTVSAPQPTATLGGQNAEWIVEDFLSNNVMVPFANFGTVKFTSASAGISSGSSVGTTGADVLDISQNGTILTDASIPSSSEVDVKYTGP